MLDAKLRILSCAGHAAMELGEFEDFLSKVLLTYSSLSAAAHSPHLARLYHSTQPWRVLSSSRACPVQKQQQRPWFGSVLLVPCCVALLRLLDAKLEVAGGEMRSPCNVRQAMAGTSAVCRFTQKSHKPHEGIFDAVLRGRMEH